MYDTIFARLTQGEVQGIDFLAETPCYLDNVAEHTYSDGVVVTGDVGNLKVTLNHFQVKVRDGSLCKWYLGSNFKTMGRKDTQMAIERLSDTLHLPIGKAIITRIDVAQNLITRYPPDVYYNHLGLLKYATRLQEPNGIYYSQTGGRLAFYDKCREQRAKGEDVPELYEGKNVLRYEQRYTKRIARQLNVPEVTGSMLYNEGFYIGMLNRWRDTYRNIQKVNDVNLNFGVMKTKQQLYRMGVLSLIKQAGGQLEFIAQINEAKKRGELTNKQAFDLRTLVKDVCKARDGFTAPSVAIQELDKKVSEAIRFYR